MLCHEFSPSITHEPHEEYLWPSHGSLGLQDIQAISNLAGFGYTYGTGGPTSSERTDSAEFADNAQFYCYNIQHPQTISLHYEYAYEVHSENQQLQESVRTNDDGYYYTHNGLLSAHRFAGSAHTIETQPLCREMMMSLCPNVQKNSATGSHPEEPFSPSLTLPFPPATVDNPFNNIDSYPKINHDSILPNQHSTYSELSANLVYMTTQTIRSEGEAAVAPQKEGGAKRRKKAAARVKPTGKQLRRYHEGAPISQRSLPKRSKTERKGGRGRGSDSHPTTVQGFRGENRDQGFQSLKHIPPPSNVGRTSTTSPGRASTKKKLGLACLFCRERKIACGRPSESNPDQTCNQCARRSFKCEYPVESRRGQHKRPKSKPCGA